MQTIGGELSEDQASKTWPKCEKQGGVLANRGAESAEEGRHMQGRVRHLKTMPNKPISIPS